MAIGLGEIFIGINARTTGLQKGLKRGRDSLGRFSKSALQTEVSLGQLGIAFAAVAGPIALLSKEAIDSQETLSKFNTVFADVRSQADETSKNLSENFGLSSVKAKQLLSDTGDLLSGFGFTGQAALELSTEVNKLAVDLASFTNFSGGAEGASQALTKALLGERESVKSLGISILETDVAAEVLKLEQEGLTFETERQAKAFATLRIAQRQSKNAIGDFARTSDQAANLLRRLRADLQDIAVGIGKEFIPVIEKAARALIPLTKTIKELVGPPLTELERKIAVVNDKLAINEAAIRAANKAGVKNIEVLKKRREELARQRNELVKLQAQQGTGRAPETGAGPSPAQQRAAEETARTEKAKTEAKRLEFEAQKMIAEDALNREIELQLISQINAEEDVAKKIVLEEQLAEFRKQKGLEVNNFQQQLNQQLFQNLTTTFGKSVAEIAKGQKNLGNISKKVVRSTTDFVLQALATQLAAETALTIKRIAQAKAVASSRAIAAEAGKGLLGLATATVAVSAFSALISKVAGFQQGGVIAGTPSPVDNVLIRARTGERILTPEQNRAFERGISGARSIVVQIFEPTVDSDSRLDDLADRVGGVVIDRLGLEARGIVA